MADIEFERFISAIAVDDWRISPCCFERFDNDAEILEQSLNVDQLLYFSQCISAVYDGNIVATATVVHSVFPTAVIHYPNIADPLTPKWILIDTFDRWILVVEGTTSFPQLMGQILSSVKGCKSYGGYDTSTVVETMARQIFGQVKTLISTNTNPLIVCGHSLGGAVSRIIMCMNLRQGDTRKCCHVSFGEPRHCGRLTQKLLASVPQYRCVLGGDPIPWLPPHIDDISSLLGLVGVLVAKRWASFVHGVNGQLLGADGSIRPMTPSDYGNTSTLVTLIAHWLIDGTVPNPLSHTIANYISALTLAQP